MTPYVPSTGTQFSLPISMLLGPPSPTFLSLLFITIHPVKSSHLLLFLPGFLIPLLGKFISEGTCTAKQLSLKIHSFGHSIALRNSIVHDIRKAKSSYLCSLSISSRSFWSHVRSIRKSKSPIPTLKTTNYTCSTDSGKANLLNTTFADFFTKDPLLPPLPPLFLACSPDLLCSAESVSKLIDCLPNDTSPGPDAISSLLLKATASAISYPLSLLFNLSITSGFFPSTWKASIVVPIPKTSPPSDSPSDYRPISLLSLVSKLLEKHIANILFAHLLSRNLIPPNQFDFVPSRSTSDALTSACHLIFSSLDSLSSSCGVFLDLRKAFDSVSHSCLLEKLYSLDLPPNLCSWLYSYLSGRSQRVRIGTNLSNSLPVSSGVPQGSILGPLFFIIFFNDIASLSLSPSSKLFIYADDVLLLHSVICPSDITSLNLDLQIISSWLSQKSLCINVKKSKYMFFSFRPQLIFNHFPSILISGSCLERVYSFKYLGVLLTPNLSWLPHINFLRSKAKRIFGLIYRQFYQSCPPSTLLVLYKSLVRPVLEYCSILWDPSSKNTINSIESVQYLALKIVSKSWNSDYESLLSQFNLQTL